MRALLMSGVLLFATAGGAVAASMARLQIVQPKQEVLVLDGRVWRCHGLVCEASGQGRSQGLPRECARVARKLGPLTAYMRNGVVVDRAGLDRCNREARVR